MLVETTIGLRFNVWRHRAALDAALAEGANPAGDAELVFRARQLTRPTTRQALARTLRDVIVAAEEAPAGVGTQPPLRRHAVLAACDDLVRLAELLREGRPVPPQAAALATKLVWDSASPVYAPATAATVRGWTRTVLDIADGRG